MVFQFWFYPFIFYTYLYMFQILESDLNLPEPFICAYFLRVVIAFKPNIYT